MKTKKKEIYNRLVKSIKSSKPQGYRSSFTERKTHKTKSFSPNINRELDVKQLKSLKNESVNLCNNLLQINIGTISKPRCLNFNNLLVKKFLLKNLMASKHLDPSKFIAPKQLYSNCWFNTMFVTFFFSDKGRKFFRFFRNLMITGRKVDKSRLEDSKERMRITSRTMRSMSRFTPLTGDSQPRSCPSTRISPRKNTPNASNARPRSCSNSGSGAEE